MRTAVLTFCLIAAGLILVGGSTRAEAQVGRPIVRAQTERVTEAVQDQMRETVRPHLAAKDGAGAQSSDNERDGTTSAEQQHASTEAAASGKSSVR